MPTPAELMARRTASAERARLATVARGGLAGVIANIPDVLATFARGGGGSKAKAKGGKSSKKAKGAAQAGSGGACCKAEGGKFAPGNNYGSLGGKASSQRAAANRVKERLAAKSKGAKIEKEAAAASARVATAKGMGSIVARSKAAAVEHARVVAAKEKSALDKRQARNKKAREKRAAAKAARAPATPARDERGIAVGRNTPERSARAAAARDARAGVQRISKDTPITEGKVTTSGGRKELILSRGEGQVTIEETSRGSKTFRVVNNYYGPSPGAAGGVSRQAQEFGTFDSMKAAKEHARKLLTQAGYVAPGGKLSGRHDPPARGETRRANIIAARARAGADARMVERSKQAARAAKAESNQKAWRDKEAARKESFEKALAASKDRQEAGAAKRAATMKAKREAKAASSSGAAPKPASTPADRAPAIRAMVQKSRVASGKAGAENAARKRAAEAAAGGRKDTFVDTLAMASPSGKMSKRFREASTERLRQNLFGKEGLKIGSPKVDEVASLKQRAVELRGLAARGMKPRAHAKEAATLEAKAAALSGAASKPATPVKPPPAAVERRPITDPVRAKAESAKMDEAFARAPGGKDNFVSLKDLHATMPHLTRDEFVAVVRKGQDDGKYGLENHEGAAGPAKPGVLDAAIVERGRYRDEPLRLAYIRRNR